MLKAVRSNNPKPSKPRRPKHRRLRTIAMLPTLLTLGNLYFGFAAAYYCGREMEDLGRGRSAAEVQTLKSAFLEARAPSFLSVAAWMLIGAMVCDALDGRVARRTGQSSKFGEQLDSLGDIVSFGLVPALMMVTMVHRELAQRASPPFGLEGFGHMAVFVGAIYVCCAALRLARFTVEASLEEAAHVGFRGMPSPGAAGAVGSLIFLHDHLDAPGTAGWAMTADVIVHILPFCTLLVALLMVSRVPYAHAVSSFLRRRPFGHVILVLLIVPLLLRFTEEVLVIAAWAFVVTGPARLVARRLRGGSRLPDTASPPAPSQEPIEPQASRQAP